MPKKPLRNTEVMRRLMKIKQLIVGSKNDAALDEVNFLIENI